MTAKSYIRWLSVSAQEYIRTALTTSGINAGVTIDAADYELAYFGYESAVSDSDETEFETMVLSGEDPLEIINVDSVEGQESVEEGSRDSEAGTDGRAVVWSVDNPPEPLATPGDYADYRVIVEGDTTTGSQDISNVVEDGSDYVLETSALAEGETIANVEIIPPVNYERSHDYTADATNVDTQETLDRLEQQRQQIDDLEEALEEDNGGSWWPSISGPDLGGGFSGQLAGLVVIAVIVVSVIWSVIVTSLPAALPRVSRRLVSHSGQRWAT